MITIMNMFNIIVQHTIKIFKYHPPCRQMCPLHFCSTNYTTVVVVCLPRPMEGMGRLQFSDLFSQNCQFHHRRLESLEHLMCLIYILLSTTDSHFLDLTDAFFFYKVSPFFCIHFHFCKYTLHVCYVFNVNLTDSFDGRRSQCRLIE